MYTVFVFWHYKTCDSYWAVKLWISLCRTRAPLEHSTVPEKESSDIATSRTPLKARSEPTVTSDVYSRPLVDSRYAVRENGNLDTVHCQVPPSFRSETHEQRYVSNGQMKLKFSTVIAVFDRQCDSATCLIFMIIYSRRVKSRLILENNCPWSTTLLSLITLTQTIPWALTLTFNPRRVMAMTCTCAEYQGQGSFGLEALIDALRVSAEWQERYLDGEKQKLC